MPSFTLVVLERAWAEQVGHLKIYAQASEVSLRISGETLILLLSGETLILLLSVLKAMVEQGRIWARWVQVEAAPATG